MAALVSAPDGGKAAPFLFFSPLPIGHWPVPLAGRLRVCFLHWLGPCLVRGLGAGADCGLLVGLGMTAGWGETEVPVDVSSRRLALVLHRHLAEHGLLSFLSLLRAFLLNVIQRNQAPAR